MSTKIRHPELLRDIDAFLDATGMGSSYLGKASVGNSELVPRLRNGGRVFRDTEDRVRAFMAARLEEHAAGERSEDAA